MESPLIHVHNLHIHLPQSPHVGPVDLGKIDLSRAENAAAKPRFELSPDGSYVTDHQTGIQWANDTTADYMSYEAAEKYCAEIVIGSLRGWRLATLAERETIIDRTRFNPAMPSPFKSRGGYEWTSTEYLPSGKNDKGQPRALWRVYGSLGSVDYGGRDGHGFVRPCRLVSAPGQ